MTHMATKAKVERRLAVFIEDDLYREAKIQAAKEGITLRQLISSMLSDYVIRHKKRGQ